jgi:Glyoxalase-like domain
MFHGRRVWWQVIFCAGNSRIIAFAAGAVMSPRIDHLVLPVAGLAIARSRLALLGFTVAPDADHPFGTSNACVFLADGTYLEPLAWRDEKLVRASAHAGNQFTARDIGFRKAAGDNGFSALVVTSEDAEADHARFKAAGVSGGEMLEFSRQALTADGRPVTARFRLSFADAGSDVGFLLSCERLNPLPADRAALERHDNGAIGLKTVVLTSDAPLHQAPVLALLTSQEGKRDGDDLVYALPNARLRITQGGSTPLSGHMLVFRSADLSVTEAMLAANQVAFEKRGARIVVPAAPGQGAVFAFED